MKKIVTIQDISCLGKCSLTVALPIISALGTETVILPTAILSAHTAFKNFTFKDLTDQFEPVKNHWINENINFDCIYTGYLGSYEQLKLIGDFISDFKTKDNFVFIDPVMGDNGKLYSGFDENFAKEMFKLCSNADIIVPNITEASYMLNMPYPNSDYTEEDIKKMLVKLSENGTKYTVITGISFDNETLGIMAYNSTTKKFFKYFNKKINMNFHGTGDVFSSSCVGFLMKGYSFEKSLKNAVDFTLECIKCTLNDKNINWYGVNFEEAIPYLLSL